MGVFWYIKIFCIFDLQNVNKCMLKNRLIISSSHFKYKNILVYLHTFNSVIINITILIFLVARKSLENKRFPYNWKPFFVSKNFTLSTIKI